MATGMAQEERAALRAHLESTSIRDLMRDGAFHADPQQGGTGEEKIRSVVSIDLDASVIDALRTLRKHRIQSAPVRDAEAEEEFVGSVDTLDLLHTVLRSLVLEEPEEGEHPREWAPYARSVAELKDAEKKLATLNVVDIMDSSKLNAWSVVKDQGNVLQLIDDALHKLHRVGVSSFDSDHKKEKLVGLVSQMDVVHLLGDWMFGRNGLPDMTVKDLGVGTEAIVSMSLEAPAVAAFFLMMWNKVSAVAIVDKDRRLVANLSASDISGITGEQLHLLALSVKDFLSKRIELTDSFITISGPQPAVSITHNTTLSNVLFKLSTFKLHRLWIVDENEVPVGCLSTSDIMQFVQKYVNGDDNSTE
jgi:5'-AMP-activated protein kinase, regulatory gamma subunit